MHYIVLRLIVRSCRVSESYKLSQRMVTGNTESVKGCQHDNPQRLFNFRLRSIVKVAFGMTTLIYIHPSTSTMLLAHAIKLPPQTPHLIKEQAAASNIFQPL